MIFGLVREVGGEKERIKESSWGGEEGKYQRCGLQRSAFSGAICLRPLAPMQEVARVFSNRNREEDGGLCQLNQDSSARCFYSL